MRHLFLLAFLSAQFTAQSPVASTGPIFSDQALGRA
jgi:hypothetical protein